MIKNIFESVKNKKVALALGYFDAIHIGHQSIINTVKNIKNVVPAVFTFSNNIYELLHKDIKEIYPFRERCNIIKSYGVEEVYYVEADKSFLNMSGNDFLDLLCKHINIAAIVSGDDYTYGKAADCNKIDLKNYCDNRGIEYIALPLIDQDGIKISSTRIREWIQEGDMLKIYQALGRPYSITSKIVDGRKDGRQIGYPTINMAINEKILTPKSGVYSSSAVIDGKKYKGVTNIGEHPTFGDFNINIETHLIGYNGDLYDKTIKLDLVKYLRSVRHFDCYEALKAQIAKDINDITEDYYD